MSEEAAEVATGGGEEGAEDSLQPEGDTTEGGASADDGGGGDGGDDGGEDGGGDMEGLDFPDEEEEEEEVNQLLTAVVPRLDDLIVKCLAENYDAYPALDRIPPEYLDNVVALLDPSQIDFSVAAKYINAEKFWKRLSQERWPICQPGLHGMSWKRMYIERHLQALFEAYYPSNQGQNYERLMIEVTSGKHFVHTITIFQLLSHLDLSDILVDFPHLSSLTLVYGARKLGMDYDKSLFGMQLKDAMHLSKVLATTRSLTKVVLSENLLNDESIHIVASGLQNNDTLTYLDLSHNKISDTGAKRLARLLKGESVLTHLDLGDNRIHETGAKALGDALKSNVVLMHLSLKLNPLGDGGGLALISSIQENNSRTSLRSLNLAGVNMTANASKALESLVESNDTLTNLDISSNDILISPELAAALKRNTTITAFDVRRNPVASDDVLHDIKALLTKRYAKAKQHLRKAYQDGWDEM
jgi:hypothetical protein